MTSGNPLGSLLGGLLGSGGKSGGGGNLLGSLLGALGGSGGGSGGKQGSNPLSGLLGMLNSNQAEPEMRQKAESWVSTDQKNQEISPEEVSRAVPAAALHQAAQENGLTDDQAATELAQTLPEAVDKLTPNGSGDLNRSLDDILGSGGGQKAA